MNIPADGQWIFKFNTLSTAERMQRLIQLQKSYALLPHELDKAQEDWLEEQPEPEPTVEFTETLEGETLLGGEMRLSFKPENDTTV